MERVILTTGMILIAAAAVAVGTTRTPEPKHESTIASSVHLNSPVAGLLTLQPLLA